ncbi:MAG: C45 family autoproteolytic acyltransferase/hydrolase [Planctomycetota bacterium]
MTILPSEEGGDLRPPEHIVYGDPCERGRQHGRHLKDTLEIPDMNVDPDFVRGCYRAAENAYPPIIPRFEGMAIAGGFERSWDHGFLPYYFARLESQLGGPGGCTIFGVPPALRSRPGRGTLVGRNYDWAAVDRKWCRVRRVFPALEPDRIGYTHHWAGLADVLTEEGLYIAIASLPPEPVASPGVQWHVVVDMLAGSCSHVDDAIEKCAEVRHLRPMSYLLADEDTVAVVEATPSEIRVRRGSAGPVVVANVPLGGQLLNNWRESGRQTYHPHPQNYSDGAIRRAKRRISYARSMLDRSTEHSPLDFMRLLRDHTVPLCTGNHTRTDSESWSTIWSGLCEPSPRTFRIAPGPPCLYPYLDFGRNFAGRINEPPSTF